jgi:hypothetical protein
MKSEAFRLLCSASIALISLGVFRGACMRGCDKFLVARARPEVG